MKDFSSASFFDLVVVNPASLNSKELDVLIAALVARREVEQAGVTDNVRQLSEQIEFANREKTMRSNTILARWALATSIVVAIAAVASVAHSLLG